MTEKKVICLQEVTGEFIYQSGCAREELTDLLNTHKYDVYANFYSFDRVKKRNTLGLAVFVPINLFKVTDVALLRPWKEPLKSQSLSKQINDLHMRIESHRGTYVKQCKDKQIDESKITKQEINSLTEKKAELTEAMKKQGKTPSYNDRSVFMLRLRLARVGYGVSRG